MLGHSRARRREAGMVTAELAVALPVAVLVLACCLAGVLAAVDQVRCVDAARSAGRAAARGDPIDRVRAAALEAAPPGATVRVDYWGGDVAVVVTSRTGGWGGIIPTWQLIATATSTVERSEAGP